MKDRQESTQISNKQTNKKTPSQSLGNSKKELPSPAGPRQDWAMLVTSSILEPGRGRTGPLFPACCWHSLVRGRGDEEGDAGQIWSGWSCVGCKR